MLKQYLDESKIEVGIDEAGRGCLFGPVCVAAVIWPHEDPEPCLEIKDSKQVSEKKRYLLKDYIESYFPDSFKVTVNQLGPLAKPLMVDTKNIYFKKAIKALEITHNKSILVQGEGGSIPILAEFQFYYERPIILIGMNAPNDNIHAPNERFKRSDYMDGIKVYINLIDLISNGITH